MKKQRSRNLDVVSVELKIFKLVLNCAYQVHSGLILWQQPVEQGKPIGRERMARLLLTKGTKMNKN
jgi:hypothetical protein